MAFAADFDSPQTTSGISVAVTGTIPASATVIESMQLTVTRDSATSPEYFYLTKEYTNSATSPSRINQNLIISIVPAFATGDTVSVTTIGGGSIIGQIDIKTS